MKKIIVFLCILAILIPVFCINSFAAKENSAIMKTAVAPKIDGELDDCYKLVADSKKDTLMFHINIISSSIKNQVQIYSCWDNEYLYLFIKADCNEPHVAYMDNANEHWIFNAHYAMTSICPDDASLDVYKGTADDIGGWEWGELYNSNFMYEWTEIKDSKTKENVMDCHFGDVKSKTGFEYDVKSSGGYDCYEQKIPLKLLTSSQAANGIKPEIGSVFGLGVSVGFSDVGNGYVTEQDKVNFSDYYEGKKNINGLVLCELKSDLKPGEESSVVSSEDTSSEASNSSEVISEPTSEDDSSVTNSSKESNDINSSTTSEDDPKDFDDWWIVIAAVGTVVIVAGLVYIVRRKKV